MRIVGIGTADEQQSHCIIFQRNRNEILVRGVFSQIVGKFFPCIRLFQNVGLSRSVRINGYQIIDLGIVGILLLT